MARIMIKVLLERIGNERARSVKHSLCALACGLCFLAGLLSRDIMPEDFSVVGWPPAFGDEIESPPPDSEDDCDSNLAVKARWQVYRDSDDSFMAEKTSGVMVERYPENLSWRLHQADAIFCEKGAKAAYELMLSEQERFENSAKYFFSLGRYAVLAGLWVQAKKFACISGQLDGNFTQAFIDEVSFEPIWRNRVANPWSLTLEAGAFNFKKALRTLRKWLEQECEDE